MRLLLVEDDARLADHTAEYLRGHGIAVVTVGDGAAGLARALTERFDLVLLDLMLPGIDGLEICRELRRESDVPILMLTARGEEADRVVGLELGADDYLAKPFSPRELLARIRAVARRSRAHGRVASALAVGPLRLDRERRTAFARDVALQLTAHQFDVLWALCERPGRVIERERLYNRVRQLQNAPPAPFDPTVDRSIDVHVSNLRQILGAAGIDGGALIRTLRGVGYLLEAPAPP
jgi:DNA-binding response OmpR family regulator